MPPPSSIFWPIDETKYGYVVGWKGQQVVVALGTASFESLQSEDDVRHVLLRLNDFISSNRMIECRKLELLGVYSGCEGSGNLLGPFDVMWSPSISELATETQIVFYRRHKKNTWRYYRMDIPDLHHMLRIQPYVEHTRSVYLEGNSTSLRMEYIRQDEIALLQGINSTLLDLFNSADEIMSVLNHMLGADTLDTVEKEKAPFGIYAIRAFAILLWTRRKLWCAPRPQCLSAYTRNIWKFTLTIFASAQQIDIRRDQLTFIFHQLSFLLDSGESKNTLRSVRYISMQNCIWLILNDIIIGCAIGLFFIQNKRTITNMVYRACKFFTVTLVRATIHWLDNWPAGLKLNTELSHFLFIIFNLFLDIWEGFLEYIEKALPFIVLMISISGMFGLTMVLTLFSDLVTLLTLHLTFSYIMMRRIFKNQILMAVSLFNLFRGKRYNVLRQRLDDWNYDLDQLILGTMLFALISFLFPTISVYYLTFALIRLGFIVLQAGTEFMLALFNHFPLFALTLKLKDPCRLPGGLMLRPIVVNQSDYPCLLLQNSSVPLSAIFGQFLLLGLRLRVYYDPRRLAMKIIKGDRLDLIPQRFTRYMYVDHT